MPGLIASLLLASSAATVTSADRAALDAATHAIYAPYLSNGLNEDAVWERNIWSREMRQLITRWQSVLPEDDRWLIDDMHTEDYSEGIKIALRQTILDDEAMIKARK